MNLPEGWTDVELGEIADFVMGQAPPGEACNPGGIGTPFVKAGEFGLERPIIREWTTRPLKLAMKDDVLICVVGATAGKINLGADCAIGRSVAAIRPTPATTASFIYPRLKSEVARLRSGSTGTAQGVISRDMLAGIQIALPPLAEQHRIVEKLEALTARLNSARQELDRVSGLAVRLRQSTLTAAFSGELTARWRSSSSEPPWNVLPLKAMISDGPSNGWSPKSGPDATGSLTLKLTATTSGTFRLDDAATKRIYDTPPLNSKYWLKSGDLLVQRANSLEYVGASAIFDGPDFKYIYPDLMMRIRIDDPTLRRLVWYFLNSADTRRYFQARATGTAGNMPKISGPTLKELPIPVPSAAEQVELLARIDTAFARAARLESEAARARALLDRLEAAILAKAFRGELVPQDPADEPASVLLDRIRAQRAASPSPARGRRPAFTPA